MRPIIDAHLDLAWNALSFRRDQTESLDLINAREQNMYDSRARGSACVSLPEMRRGGVAICLATIICGAKRNYGAPSAYSQISPDCGTQDMAYAVGHGQLAYYRLLEARSELSQIRSSLDLERHWQAWQQSTHEQRPVGFILAMEGADPIVEPQQVEAWWNDGLRCVMLAHYGRGRYSDGTGGHNGLTADGRDLLREMRRFGMILDLSHTTDPGFFDSIDLYDGSVMASHTNCRAIVPGSRQFSNEQIKLLIQREAVIGLALDAWMLRSGWVIGQSSPAGLTLASIVEHIDHICQLAGNANHIAIGSDLDGGFGAEQRPEDVRSIADIQSLASHMTSRGYTNADVDKIFHGNWLQFFRRNLPQR